MFSFKPFRTLFLICTLCTTSAFSIESVTGYDGIPFSSSYHDLLAKGFSPIFTNSGYIHKELQLATLRGIKLSPEILADTNQYDPKLNITMYNDTTLLNLAVANFIGVPNNILLDSIFEEEIARQKTVYTTTSINNSDSIAEMLANETLSSLHQTLCSLPFEWDNNVRMDHDLPTFYNSPYFEHSWQLLSAVFGTDIMVDDYTILKRVSIKPSSSDSIEEYAYFFKNGGIAFVRPMVCDCPDYSEVTPKLATRYGKAVHRFFWNPSDLPGGRCTNLAADIYGSTTGDSRARAVIAQYASPHSDYPTLFSISYYNFNLMTNMGVIAKSFMVRKKEELKAEYIKMISAYNTALSNEF